MPDAQVYIQDVSLPEKTSRPRSSAPKLPKLGNPTPLVFILSIYNTGAFGIQIPNVVVGVSLFTGGVVQFAAGMWEFKVGNTFGGTGFGAFGGFWASYGVIYIPAFGIQEAFGVTTDITTGSIVAINATA
ncbi:3120_t:CDS:2, partial [Acaulospora colombiana]